MGAAPSLILPPSVISEALYRWRGKGTASDEGLVVLLRVLKHSVNAGYNLDAVRILRRVNGKNVTRLADLLTHVCGARTSGERFLYFSFAEDDQEVPSETPEDPDVVLETAAIAAADKDILAANGIPNRVSQDLRAAAACDTGDEETEKGGL